MQRGETIEVTDRGRPVALLVPVPHEGGLDELAAAGRLERARGDALELGEPLNPGHGEALPSELLGALRADER